MAKVVVHPRNPRRQNNPSVATNAFARWPVAAVLGAGFLALAAAVVGFRHFRAEVLGEAAGEEPFRTAEVRAESTGGGQPPLVVVSEAANGSGAFTRERVSAVRFQPEAVAVGSLVDPVDLAETRAVLSTVYRANAQANAALELARSQGGSQPIPPDGDEAVPPPVPAAPGDEQRLDEADVDRIADAARLRRAVAVALYGPVIADWMQAGSAELDPFLQHRASLLLLTPMPGRSASLQPEATVTDRLGQPAHARLVSVAFRVDPRLQDVVGLYRVDDDPGSPRFVPGPAVSARLLVGPVLAGTIAPAGAVLRHEGRAWVYVEEAPGRFRRREISLDRPLPDGSGWFQERGLAAGQTVVTGGGALLLAEER